MGKVVIEMTEDIMRNVLDSSSFDSSSDKPKNKEKKRKKRGLWLLLSGLCIILALLLVYQGGYLQFPKEESNGSVVAGNLFPGSGSAVDGHLPGMTPEEIMEQMQKIADASHFSFKINSRPVLADGNAPANFRIENPSYNVYPMVVQIILNETEEVLFDSGGIMPNQYIESAKLTKTLEPGTYNATAVFNAYDPATGIHQGKAQAALIITVLS